MRAARLFWLTGFFVGGALSFYWDLHNAGKVGPQGLDMNIFLENLTYLFWPTSLMLMPLTGEEHRWTTIIIESLSVIANGFVYAGVGSLFVALYRKVISSENNARQK